MKTDRPALSDLTAEELLQNAKQWEEEHRSRKLDQSQLVVKQAQEINYLRDQLHAKEPLGWTIIYLAIGFVSGMLYREIWDLWHLFFGG